MSNDQSDYEVFLSYARADNRPIPETYPHGWVSALKEQLEADHRQYETSPLRIFFDTREIRDMDDWRNRIRGALRQSKVLLICLSPAYFQSDACRWEWDEYQARQHQKLIGSDSHATVYFVEVPNTDEQDNARRLETILGRNYTDLRPWFPAGAAAMREEAVRKRMAALGQSLWERIDRARRALSVPGNIRGMTPYFVGRTPELARLHQLVCVGKVGVITAVHGLGGQGKTELAVAYARGHAHLYSLGLWSLGAESHTELLPLIGKLGLDPRFGYTPTEAEKNDAERLGLGVLLELGRRAEAMRQDDPMTAPAALLILDNVSEPSLLVPTQLSRLPAVDWLRLVATTRLDPDAIDPARKQLGAVEVDSLDPGNALRLIADHLPGGTFNIPQDEADAREIVRELGGFTLAVEQVAVFLGLNPDVTPGAYLTHLRANGLPTTDDLVDPQATGQIEHQTKLLRPIVESMIEPLGAAGRTLLKLAALLPPERIPWPWLKELTLRHHPELATNVLPNAWTRLRRQVQGLRLLNSSMEDHLARMHRLIAAHVRTDVDKHLDAKLRAYIVARADEIGSQQTAPTDWELDGLLDAIPHLLDERPDGQIAVHGMFLTDKVIAYRNLPTARALVESTGSCLQSLAGADPRSAQKQRDLAVSFNRMGDVSMAAGDLKSARGYFENGLRISQSLAAADPTSAQNQCDLCFSYERLGEISMLVGDLNAARGYIEDSLRISQSLANVDPTSAHNQRSLYVSFSNLGDVSVAAGDLKSARDYFEKSLRISQSLAAADPGNVQNQRDLYASFNKLGDVSMAAGDLKSARSYFEDGLRISQSLTDADATNAQKQRDLYASFNRLGDVSMAAGELKSARSYFEDGLRISQSLADADATNAQKQRDLSVLFNRLGDVSRAVGDLKSARGYFESSLRINQSLADTDAMSAENQRVLSVCYERLGDVSMAAGDLNAARRYFDEGLRLRRTLADNDPENAEKQRDLWVSLWRIALMLMSERRYSEARTHWQMVHGILQGMLTRGLHVSPQDREVLQQVRGLIRACSVWRILWKGLSWAIPFGRHP